MVLDPARSPALPPCDFCPAEAVWRVQRLADGRRRVTLATCNAHRRTAVRTLRRPAGHAGPPYRVSQRTLLAF